MLLLTARTKFSRLMYLPCCKTAKTQQLQSCTQNIGLSFLNFWPPVVVPLNASPLFGLACIDQQAFELMVKQYYWLCPRMFWSQLIIVEFLCYFKLKLLWLHLDIKRLWKIESLLTYLVLISHIKIYFNLYINLF